MTAETFWNHVAVGAPDECWEWTGARSNGYGSLRWGGRTTLAHRVAKTLSSGPIPAGMVVCHRCDNPPCVNPGHLFVGTYSDNSSDMVAKGRNVFTVRYGVETYNAKLTDEIVAEAVAAVRAGESRRSVSRRLGINKGCLSRMVRGLAWSHVTGEVPR